MNLDDQLDRIVAARDRSNMQPTIDALKPLYQAHPENSRVLYEIGGAYDTDGQEEKAANFYERALAHGLSGDLLRRCYLQYGSTLRNIGRVEESLAVFRTARQTFPDSPSLATFQAVTMHAAGRPNDAIATLLQVIAEHVTTADIDRYKPAILGNAAYIRDLQ